MDGLTIEQAKKVIKVAISVNQPILIHGAPGVGKTAFVKALAEELNMKFIDIRPSQTPSEEITGVGNFVVDKNGYKRFEKTLPTIFPTDKDIKAILFIDELTNCQKDVQDVLMSVINERSLGATFYNGEQYKLPDGVAIVAACNDSDTSINANELSQPLKNRFGHIYITNDTTELADGWLKWAKSAGINPAVIGYIEKNKNKIYERDKLDNEEMIYLTPRSWEAVSKILNANQITSGTGLKDVVFCVNAYVNNKKLAVNLVENSLSARGNASGIPEPVIGYLDDNNLSFFFESLPLGIKNLKSKPSETITSCYLSEVDPLKRLISEKKSIDGAASQKLAFALEQVAFWWEVFCKQGGCNNWNLGDHELSYSGNSIVCKKLATQLSKVAREEFDDHRQQALTQRYTQPSVYPGYNWVYSAPHPILFQIEPCDEECYNWVYSAPHPIPKDIKVVFPKADCIEKFSNMLHSNIKHKYLVGNANAQIVLDNFDDAIKLIDEGLFVRWAWINGRKDTEEMQEKNNKEFKQFLHDFKQTAAAFKQKSQA